MANQKKELIQILDKIALCGILKNGLAKGLCLLEWEKDLDFGNEARVLRLNDYVEQMFTPGNGREGFVSTRDYKVFLYRVREDSLRLGYRRPRSELLETPVEIPLQRVIEQKGVI